MVIDLNVAFRVRPEAIAELKERTGYSEAQIIRELTHRYHIIMETYLIENNRVELEHFSKQVSTNTPKGDWRMYPVTLDETTEKLRPIQYVCLFGCDNA